MTGFPTAGELPGTGAKVTTAPEVAVVFGPEQMRLTANDLIIDSLARDAGNTPTTDLRAGLLLGKQTADGNLYHWDAEATDGTEMIAGVLWRPVKITDNDGVAGDRTGVVLLASPLKTADLLIKGAAFIGHADEHLARKQLANAFVLDDDRHAGTRWAGVPRVDKLITGTTLTPTAAESGTRFCINNAASVTVTMPALEPGLVYEFLRVGDEELVIASAEGDNVIVGNDLSADSITFTTAGQHLGAHVRMQGIRFGTTLKWLPTVLPVPFGTGAFLTLGIAT